MLRFSVRRSNASDRSILELDIGISILETHNCSHWIALGKARNDPSDSIVVPGPIALKFGKLH